jgi:hypothetical protein
MAAAKYAAAAIEDAFIIPEPLLGFYREHPE